jgi:hypothetical protein
MYFPAYPISFSFVKVNFFLRRRKAAYRKVSQRRRKHKCLTELYWLKYSLSNSHLIDALRQIKSDVQKLRIIFISSQTELITQCHCEWSVGAASRREAE